jgi:ABC-2 type transport system permease protein
MRFTSFGKNKQVFNFVGGIIALALALGFNIAIQSGVSNLTQAQLMDIATGQSSLVSLVSNIFPGIIFAANTLISSETLAGLGSFALFVLCSGAAVAIFLGVGQLVYFKGVAGVTETSAKRKEISTGAFGKKIKNESMMASYIKKEIRQLVRSPITFMNCVLMNFIWPVLIIAVIAGQGRSVAEISRFISTGDTGVIVAIIVGISAFVSSSNAVTSTAISREGSQFYFMKFVPAAMERQLYAKVATGFIISSLGIVIIVAAVAVLGLALGAALAALILSLAVSALCSVTGILIDAARPKLVWMNEQQAVKQNLNVMLHMLAGIAIGLAVVLPVLFIPMTMPIVLLYIAVLIALLGAVFLRRLSRGAAVRLKNMDA